MSHIVFNPPPGWPPPPPGWLPPVGWTAPKDWPAAPDGWEFLLELPENAVISHSTAYDPHPGYGVRPARKTRQEQPQEAPDPWGDSVEADEREWDQQQALRRARRTLVAVVLATMGALLLVTFFASASGDPMNQALNACGQSVRAAVNEQTTGTSTTPPVGAAPRVSLPQSGNVFNSVGGDTSALTIEGAHSTADGKTWTFSCLVDARSNPAIVLETNVAPTASVGG